MFHKITWNCTSFVNFGICDEFMSKNKWEFKRFICNSSAYTSGSASFCISNPTQCFLSKIKKHREIMLLFSFLSNHLIAIFKIYIPKELNTNENNVENKPCWFVCLKTWEKYNITATMRCHYMYIYAQLMDRFYYKFILIHLCNRFVFSKPL